MMSLTHIGALEARPHLSQILERVRPGRTYYITKRGTPVAELRPCVARAHHLSFGCDKGRVAVRADFDAPLLNTPEYLL